MKLSMINFFIFLLFLSAWSAQANQLIDDLSSEVLALKSNVAFYENQINVKGQEYQRLKEHYKNDASTSKIILDVKEHQLKTAQENLNKVQNKLNIKKSILRQLETSSPHAGCRHDMQEIDLEGPGKAFHNTHIDYQGEIGVCYANTTKNILLSLTQGEENPSFLDIALQTKNPEALIHFGLDSGGVCGALETIRSVGFCPQSFAKKETDTLRMSSMILADLFEMRALALLTYGKDQEIRQLSRDHIPSDDLFRLNFPIAIVDWKTIFAQNPKYSHQYIYYFDQFLTSELKVRLSLINDIYDERITISESTFCDEYIARMSDTFSSFSILTADVRPRVCTMISSSNYLNNFLKLKIAAISKLQFQLIHLISEIKKRDPFVATDTIYMEALKKNTHELVAMAFAPECVKKENRRMLTKGFYCEEDFMKNLRKKYNDQEVLTRSKERIVMHLNQGHAVVNLTYNHVNTIVGYRWNKLINRCEFKIRESQTGKSQWHDEIKIFKGMNAFIEVRN